jgi:hypothetical protein
MWAGVAALLAFTVYSTWNSQQLGEKIKVANERATALLQQHHDLEAELERTGRESVILTDPASVKIALAPQGPHAPPIEAKWHAKLGTILTGQKVPAPSGNRVLQLWLIPKTPGGKPIPSLALRLDAEANSICSSRIPRSLWRRPKPWPLPKNPKAAARLPRLPPAGSAPSVRFLFGRICAVPKL